ncbi:SAM-dependent methyltransferase [Legionella sp. 29fVS95]|uniref:SAM-dependent methyltransferase n=1 Tax=Legionella sp. 29fVS95 TaxID=3402813 RepID=UPI003AF80534
MANIEQPHLISHNIAEETLAIVVDKIAARIKQEGDKPYITVTEQLDLLNQLADFDFGRFLIQNQGINGYWTHYMIYHPQTGRISGKNNRGQPFTELEAFILDRSPLILATQERCQIFLQENQEKVRNGAKLACIPCGLMGELLYLNMESVHDIELIGFDYDAATLKDATQLAEQRGLSHLVKFYQQDAWELDFHNEFDLISSNGLTIYEPGDEKVMELFRLFYQALKSGGKLVTSFLTPPPTLTEQCEWDFSVINQKDLLLQKILFADVMAAKFQCYRSTALTKKQLTSLGYTDIKFLYDKAKLFPTVIAYKD